MGYSFKRKTCITFTNALQKILDMTKRHKANIPGNKPNKMLLGKGSKFCNSSMKSWIQGNIIENYSTSNEEKSVLAERFIRT